MWIILRDYVRY